MQMPKDTKGSNENFTDEYVVILEEMKNLTEEKEGSAYSKGIWRINQCN